jgi:hypothetical protein
MDIIKGKIDVSKIDKERLYKGKKGTYLDFALIPTPNGQYGNTHMIVQEVSKEERDSGVKGAILGNAKVSEGNSNQSNPAGQTPAGAEAEEDLPF